MRVLLFFGDITTTFWDNFLRFISISRHFFNKDDKGVMRKIRRGVKANETLLNMM
jgi:hypothetical protein